jgi:acetyl esterase/lipase
MSAKLKGAPGCFSVTTATPTSPIVGSRRGTTAQAATAGWPDSCIPLRDEGIAYALALLNAGVNVELHLFPGTFHGSALIQHTVISQREQAEAIAVLGQALAV